MADNTPSAASKAIKWTVAVAIAGDTALAKGCAVKRKRCLQSSPGSRASKMAAAKNKEANTA